MPRNPRRPTTDPRVAVVYLRVSTDEQSLGPEAQRTAVERWAASEGVHVAAVCADLGVSGAAPLDKRPGLLAALDALAAHGAGLLVVAKRDRLARDPIVGAMVEAAAEREGARVVSAAGEGEGDGPSDVLMRRMVDAFAEYERGVIRARTRAALAVKRSRGERIGSVPFGYSLAADGVALVAVAEEQRVIALVRGYRADGLTLRAIAARLDAAGILPRTGRAWHPQSIARIATDVAA